MAKNDGGPAFPTGNQSAYNHHRGMSIRDHFAGMAMQALFDSDAGHDKGEIAMIAQEAYEMADAMLAERDK